MPLFSVPLNAIDLRSKIKMKQMTLVSTQWELQGISPQYSKPGFSTTSTKEQQKFD